MKSDLRKFRESIRDSGGHTDPLQFVEGLLANNLPAATGSRGRDANNSLTGHTTATLRLIEWSSEGDEWYFTGRTVTITNRSTVFSAGPDTYLCAFAIGGEFRPLPTFQTTRGRMLVEVVTDDVVSWPRQGLMEVLEPGRNFANVGMRDSSPDYTITATDAGTGAGTGTFTLDGDATLYATTDRYLIVTGTDIDGTYTIISSSFASSVTTVTVAEVVGPTTLTASSSARIPGDVMLDGDQSNFVLVGDTLTLWQLAGTLTALIVDVVGATTVVTVDEEVISAGVTDELAATTLVSRDTNTLWIAGDIRPESVTGHFIQVENAGSANGYYTILRARYFGGNTNITTLEVVPTGTITGSSTARILRTVMTTATHPDPRMTLPILSVTAAALGNITTDAPDDIHEHMPFAQVDMFLEGHRVRITGSENGENDGVFRCRADHTVSGGDFVIKLDGQLVTPTGALGSVTFLNPPPMIVKGKELAVLRWYDAVAQKWSIVHTLPPDGEDWREIVAISNPQLFPDDE